jgi:hypothetical protein
VLQKSAVTGVLCISCMSIIHCTKVTNMVALLVEALCCKPGVLGFKSQ